MPKRKSKGESVWDKPYKKTDIPFLRAKEEIETLKEENIVINNLVTSCLGKRTKQAFEIIDLKEKISELKAYIILLVMGIIFISLICIIK